MDFLSAQNVSGSRSFGSEESECLGNVTIGFQPASLNILYGGRGSGRNLLLRYLGLLERPASGDILVTGESTHGWEDARLIETRSRNFGFVFESPLLLPSFNVAENIAMPFFKLTQATPDQAREATRRALEEVGLPDCANTAVESLPLWAQQRVSIARALVTHPRALFVENIDTLSRDGELISLLELLSTIRRLHGCCIIVSAAHGDLAHFATRAVEMAGGNIMRDWNPGGLLS